MTKISNLPSDSSPTTTDLVPTVDVESNTTKKSTLANLITLFFNNIPNLKITTASIQADAVTATKIDWASTGADAGIWWEELGRATLGTAGDSLSITVPARKYLYMIVVLQSTGGTIAANLRFNSDSGSNYARRRASNGAADSTSTSADNLTTIETAGTEDLYGHFHLQNIATKGKKLVGEWNVSSDSAGAAPGRTEFIGKWGNTTDQATTITFTNTGTGDYAIGSEIVVLGHN